MKASMLAPAKSMPPSAYWRSTVSRFGRRIIAPIAPDPLILMRKFGSACGPSGITEPSHSSTENGASIRSPTCRKISRALSRSLSAILLFLLDYCLRRNLAGPCHDIVLEIVNDDIRLALGFPPDRDSGDVDRLGISRNQGVPPVKVTPFRHQPIAAGRRQPRQARHILRRQRLAVGYALVTVRVVAATARVAVEQMTCHVRPCDLAGVFVLELVEAAAATAIAKRLPFGSAHFR